MKKQQKYLLLLLLVLLITIFVSIYLGSVKIDYLVTTKFLINRISQKQIYTENWNSGINNFLAVFGTWKKLIKIPRYFLIFECSLNKHKPI